MSGANTWNTSLLINNLGIQVSEAVAGSGYVQSVTAGANITITGTTQNPIITSTAGSGVSSIIAGTGLKQDVSTGTVTLQNTGILALTAGTGISTTGSTITNTGVLSVTAGSNTTVTGTAQNPIINAVIAPLASGTVIDVAGTNYSFRDATLLANCYLHSTVAPTVPFTVTFPNYATLVATYGANAVIPFYWGNMRQSSPTVSTSLAITSDTVPSSCYFTSDVQSNALGLYQPVASSTGYTLNYNMMYRVTVILDQVVSGTAYYCFNVITPIASGRV